MSLFDQRFDPAREAALVTGAGNGIGRAIAQALVGEGVRTIFADINPQTVKAAVESSPRPELAVPWVGDLADPRHARRSLRMQSPPSGRSRISSTAPRRRAARRTMHWPSVKRPGNGCGRSMSRPGFTSRANLREN
jgi:3-oxoacyl-[acyl-carrier protein] reductase